MSGECHSCGEHCLDCRCEFTIRVWAQMFFNDGSVSQGVRVGVQAFDSINASMRMIALKILKSLNRDEGLLLLWGAGEMFSRYYCFPTSFSSELSESDSSA